LRLVVAAVGRVRDPSERALLDDYYARIGRYATLDEVEIRADREDRVVESFTRATSRAGAGAELIALEVTGKPLSSEAFARALGERFDRAVVPVFAIGGAEGIPKVVSDRARWKLSLGPMTLPHRLARIVLAEQIYRAFTILRGEPYAREG
jgi:23S rRNA (pseudouridine1915-N3)-methyltransferase